MPEKNRPWPEMITGVIAVAICLSWFSLYAHYFCGNNWTGLYFAGGKRVLPPELAAHENVYLFPGGLGHDGHFFHLVAHDPFMRKGYAPFLDVPRLRLRRILVPGLTAILSFGNDKWVDPAYIFVILAFVYLGTYWLARWATGNGLGPQWGLLFIALPASLVTELLLVADGALAALTMGFIWYVSRQDRWRTLLVLAAAGLTREAGLMLTCGYALWLLAKRDLRGSGLAATAALPALSWFWFVGTKTAAIPYPTFSVTPFIGVVRVMVEHFAYPPQFLVLLIMDWIGIGGIMLAFGMTIYLASRAESRDASVFAAVVFVCAGIFLVYPGVWREINSCGRQFTPVLLVLAAAGLAQRNYWLLAPVALVDLRISMFFLAHALHLADVIFNSGK